MPPRLACVDTPYGARPCGRQGVGRVGPRWVVQGVRPGLDAMSPPSPAGRSFPSRICCAAWDTDHRLSKKKMLPPSQELMETEELPAGVGGGL